MSNLSIEDFSDEDLLQLLGLYKEDIVLTHNVIDQSIYDFMEKNKKLKTEKYLRFFNSARLQLYEYVDDGDDNAVDNTEDDVENDDNKEPVSQKAMLISRINNKMIQNNPRSEHYQLTNERLPIEQSHNIPIVQGQLNPNLQNINNRVLCINSQFRQNITSPSSDFTLDLNEYITNVIKMTLLSFEIKHSWYTFDTTYGTTALIFDSTIISISPGNYTPAELAIALASAFSDVGITYMTFDYSSITGKMTIGNTDTTNPHNITFYSSDNLSSSNPLISNQKINSSLGYLLGFKDYDADNNIKYTIPISSSITGNGLVDVYGPTYLLLGVEDFNNNKLNKGVISMTDEFTSLNMPSYYNCDISLSNPQLTKRINPDTGANIPSGLTTAQAYTITEIYNQQKNALDKKYGGSISSNVFARVPINKTGNFNMIVNTTSNLRNNFRNYYGPVDVSRLRVTLYDDKGYIINLNSADFSFSLLIDELYQY